LRRQFIPKRRHGKLLDLLAENRLDFADRLLENADSLVKAIKDPILDRVAEDKTENRENRRL
jgi:hypothetical protein